MTFKKEYAILILVIVGLSLYLALRSKDRTHFDLPQVAPVDAKTIDRLVFTKGDTTIELRKIDDSWVVGEKAYRADDVKARNMVRAAADLKITALVSESGNYDRYDLTDDKKTNIQVFAGKDRLRNFDVGRGAPTYQHSFVRLDGGKEVYHARGQIHDTFDATVDELRDETVLQFDQTQVSSIIIEKDERQVILAKRHAADAQDADGKTATDQAPEVQWLDQQDQAADPSAVNRLLGDFKQLKCSDYMADDAGSSLTNAIWTITFKTAAQTHRLSVFPKENEEAIEYPAVSSDSDYAFLLTKSRVEGFEKTLDQLLAGEKPE